MNKTRLSGVVGMLVLVTGLFGGCGRGTKLDVPIQGVRLPAEYPVTVEVSNFNGSVYVVGDPRAKGPEVRARVRRLEAGAPKGEALMQAVSVNAHASINGPERLLRVTSLPASEPAPPVAVDLYLKVPQTEGLTVRNAGGPVELVRVGGAVNIENGGPGKPGGDIEIRTGEAMTQPATMFTSSGRVLYQVGPGSTGRFNLMTDNGDVQFESKLGVVSDATTEPSRWRGVLNAGDNDVTLHSGDGLVWVRVLKNAGNVGPEVWDGYPRWPSKPRFIGRLGGYYNDEPLFSGGKAAEPAK